MNEIDKVRKPQVTLARMLLAAVPIVGGSATVLVDEKIAQRQQEHLSTYLDDIARRLELLEEAKLPNDLLIELGAETSKQSIDPWRPLLLSAIVAGESLGADDVVRRSLLEVSTRISEVEFCTLTSMAVHGPDISIVSDFATLRAKLSDLETHDQKIVALRRAAIIRLESFGLIEQADDGEQTISQLGTTLLELASKE